MGSHATDRFGERPFPRSVLATGLAAASLFGLFSLSAGDELAKKSLSRKFGVLAEDFAALTGELETSTGSRSTTEFSSFKRIGFKGFLIIGSSVDGEEAFPPAEPSGPLESRGFFVARESNTKSSSPPSRSPVVSKSSDRYKRPVNVKSGGLLRPLVGQGPVGKGLL